MFSKFFGRSNTPESTPAPDPAPGPQFGMVLLRATPLDPVAITRSWSELFPDVPPLKYKPNDDGSEDDRGTFEFETDRTSLMLVHMPFPIPSEEIGAAIEGSWMLQRGTPPREHAAHAVCGAVDNEQPAQAAIRVSRLLAATAKSTDAVGIYWGSGGQVHLPQMFIDCAASMDDAGPLPTMLWIGVRHSAPSPKGPWTITTTGLNAFGHKEFEVIDSNRTLGDLRMTVLELANYVITKGPILEDGDTFGATEADRIRIEHTTSAFRDGEPVIRLRM